jgi:hypothetical protein
MGKTVCKLIEILKRKTLIFLSVIKKSGLPFFLGPFPELMDDDVSAALQFPFNLP